jgi:hypothetical protein
MPCLLSGSSHTRQTKGQGRHIDLFCVRRDKKDSHGLFIYFRKYLKMYIIMVQNVLPLQPLNGPEECMLERFGMKMLNDE